MRKNVFENTRASNGSPAREPRQLSTTRYCTIAHATLSKFQTSTDSKMSVYEHDEPIDSEYCEAVRIGRDGKSAEVTIFYTPDGG